MKPQIEHFDRDKEYFFIEGCYINELHNCDNDPHMSVAQARVTPGVCTQWHRLCNTCERYVIQSGTGRVEVEGLPPTTVQAGDVVTIPENAAQRIHNTGKEDLVFLAICTPRFQPENYQSTNPDDESAL